MRNTPSLLRDAVERLVQMDTILESNYGTPEAELGNKDDPLDEAIYIVLSFQTNLARFTSTWAKLRKAYPTWSVLEGAPTLEIASTLREGGLQKQKARTIQRLLAEVKLVAGKFSLDLVRSMNDEDAEKLLTRLPGLSWKAARCVLLYSLRRDVFPVDGNTFRILRRTGVLPRQAVYRRRSLHDAVQAAVPAHRRRALHVNLVVHGQRTCLPRAPRCSICALVEICPRVGVQDVVRKHAQMAKLVNSVAVVAKEEARQ